MEPAAGAREPGRRTTIITRVFALAMRDLQGARIVFGLHVTIVLLQAFLLHRSFRGDGETSGAHTALSMAGWLVQAMLAASLMRSDSPHRLGVQWNTRPFSWHALVMARLLCLGLFVWMPPWLIGRGALQYNGFDPLHGIGWALIHHAGLISAFALLGLVTRSFGSAVLTVVGGAIGWALARRIVEVTIPEFVNSESPIWISLPVSSVMALLVSPLFLIALASAYRRGGLARPLAAVAYGCSVILSMGGFASRSEYPAEPTLPVASEELEFLPGLTPGVGFGGRSGFSLGEIMHRAKNSQDIVILEDGQIVGDPSEGPTYVAPGSGRREGPTVAIRGLDPVKRVVGPAGIDSPLDLIDGEQLDEILRSTHPMLTVSYEVRRYEALGSFPLSDRTHLDGQGWVAGVVGERATGDRLAWRRLTFTRQDPDVWAATLNKDRATLRVHSWSWLGIHRTDLASTFWTLGAGLDQTTAILEPLDFRRGELPPPGHVAIVRQTRVSEGVARFVIDSRRLTAPPGPRPTY